MAMRSLLRVNQPGPGPGSYNTTKYWTISRRPDYKPVIVQCFFKGADNCSLCGELQYGDYYRDSKKRRPLCWCFHCFRYARPMMITSYLRTINKHRHCCFMHKHIDVEDITYHLIPKSRVRTVKLKERSMWMKYGDMIDAKGLPF
ncbi:unnamed protein product [Orchesella dallaii]|uniref:Uncharacterized protein n=1 Tax=Orchesella dallaii TaxID=48710 RepID=A0ABP1S777_9HEXA